jgi:cell division septum initiation protein DivIVA
MEIGDLRAEAKRLKSAEPPRAIRGFDEEQTRTLLNGAAELLETAAGEQEKLLQECERLRSEAAEEASGKEAIGTALLTAIRTGEEIAARARAAAERITADAEARAAAHLDQAAAKAEEREQEASATRAELERDREQLARERASWHEVIERERATALEEARARADDLVADARREVEGLQNYGDRLRSLLADSQRRFVELAESALHRLDGIEAGVGGSSDGRLLDDLRIPSLDETPSASTSAADSLD